MYKIVNNLGQLGPKGISYIAVLPCTHITFLYFNVSFQKVHLTKSHVVSLKYFSEHQFTFQSGINDMKNQITLTILQQNDFFSCFFFC